MIEREVASPGHALRDEELFMGFVDGNDGAFTIIYSRYSSRLLSYIHSLLGDEAAAYDVFQEAFIKLFRECVQHREHRSLEPIHNIGGWLFRVARNLALNHLRSVRYLTELPPVLDETLIVSVEDAHAGLYSEAESDDLLLDAVSAVVKTLPVGLREAFILREVNGMSYEETAEILGCSAEAARMRLSRARCAIRKALQGVIAATRG